MSKLDQKLAEAQRQVELAKMEVDSAEYWQADLKKKYDSGEAQKIPFIDGLEQEFRNRQRRVSDAHSSLVNAKAHLSSVRNECEQIKQMRLAAERARKLAEESQRKQEAEKKQEKTIENAPEMEFKP